jgi:hypothetical protein
MYLAGTTVRQNLYICSAASLWLLTTLQRPHQRAAAAAAMLHRQPNHRPASGWTSTSATLHHQPTLTRLPQCRSLWLIGVHDDQHLYYKYGH